MTEAEHSKATILDKRATAQEAIDALAKKFELRGTPISKEENNELRKLEDEFFKWEDELDKLEKRNKDYLNKMENKTENRASSSNWVNMRTGEPIQVLTRNQPLSGIWKPTEGEQRFSVGKAVRGMVTGDWNGAGNEYRALSTSVGSAGGFSVPTSVHAQIVDAARKKSVVFNAGVELFPMETQQVSIAKLLSDPTTEYKDENLAFTDSDVTFGQLTLKAKTMGCTLTMSRELVEDSVGADDAVVNAIAQAIASEVDRAVLFGSGTALQPTGIQHTTGINKLSAVGAVVDYSEMLDAWRLILEQNGEPRSYIITPREAKTLQGMKDSAGQYIGAPQAIAALQQLRSNKIPTNLGLNANESLAFMGDFSQVLIGLRSGMIIEGSTSAEGAFNKHQVKIKAVLRYDVGVIRPEFFTLIEGITP